MKNDPASYQIFAMHRCTRVLLAEDPDKFFECANGVGSKVGWFYKIIYHIIPNWIGGLFFRVSIKKPADIHDVEYTYPQEFKTREDADKFRKEADFNFLCNCEIVIIMRKFPKPVEDFLVNWAKGYYLLLRKCGKKSFYEHKTIKGEVDGK